MTTTTLKAALGLAANLPVGVINVKSYGAAGDACKVTDGVAVVSGHHITSATAKFLTRARVGQKVWGVDPGAGGATVPVGTILSIDSDTQITVSTTPSAGTTGLHVVWGTDDTAAIQLAVTAAMATNVPGAISFPNGGYISTQQFFNFSSLTGRIPAIIGEGRENTWLFPAPDFDMSFTQSMFLYAPNGIGARVSGITVDLCSYSFSWAGLTFWYTYQSEIILTDFRLQWVRGTPGIWNAANNILGIGVHIEQCTTTGLFLDVATSGQWIGCYFGNCQQYSVDISGCAQARTRFVQCLIDESGNASASHASCRVRKSGAIESEVAFIGCTIWGPANLPWALLVQDASIVHLTSTQVYPFGGFANGNRAGISVAAAAKVFATDVEFAASGSYAAINNSGIIYDGGNNRITNGTLVGSPIGSQSITAAGAIDTDADHIRITGPSSSTYAVTLAAPPTNRHRMLTIEMIATTGTNSVTLALTNVNGGTASSTATFTVAGHKLVLAPGEAAWTVIKQQGVALT